MEATQDELRVYVENAPYRPACWAVIERAGIRYGGWIVSVRVYQTKREALAAAQIDAAVCDTVTWLPHFYPPSGPRRQPTPLEICRMISQELTTVDIRDYR
jgi:hypothetical protein